MHFSWRELSLSFHCQFNHNLFPSNELAVCWNSFKCLFFSCYLSFCAYLMATATNSMQHLKLTVSWERSAKNFNSFEHKAVTFFHHFYFCKVWERTLLTHSMYVINCKIRANCSFHTLQTSMSEAELQSSVKLAPSMLGCYALKLLIFHKQKLFQRKQSMLT